MEQNLKYCVKHHGVIYMKKALFTGIILLFILTMNSGCVISGITGNNEAKHEVTAIVLNENGGTLLFYLLESMNSGLVSVYISNTDIFAIDGTTISQDDFKTGQLVTIVYDGLIAESYPGQIHACYSIRIIGEAEEDDIANALTKYNDFNERLGSFIQAANKNNHDYAAFLAELENNGFQYIENEFDKDNFLSVLRRSLWIGDELISIYEYETSDAMEIDAGYIDAGGATITRPDKIVTISWISSPYFFKKDLIIINYVGEDEAILGFLYNTYGKPFAGRVIKEENNPTPQIVGGTPEKVPKLYLSIQNTDIREQYIEALQLTTSWTVSYDDGTSYFYGTDSPHPLQLQQTAFDEATLYFTKLSEEIILHFNDDYLPQTITVQRWPSEYAYGSQDIQKYLDKSDHVALNESSIHLEDDGQNYIYEIHATWHEGMSFYAFRMITGR